MANFTWTNAAGGDWSTASNWSHNGIIGLPRPPEFGVDTAFFGDLANPYTVTVSTTVGSDILGAPLIEIDPTTSAGPAFDISGSLTADVIYFTSAGDPATSMTIEPGGSLFAPLLLFSVDVPQTLTISGAGAGGHLQLGDLAVGGLVSGFSSLMTLDFANASLTAPNAGVIQFDNVTLGSTAIATQTITDVAWGDEFVITGANFTGDTVSLDTTTNDLTVKNGGTTVFTMNDVHLQSGATNAFVVSGDTIEAVCYFAGTMIAGPDGERAVETLSIGDPVLTSDGRVMPVRWIGRNTVSTKFADPLRVLPIRIKAGALADHLPVRDLLVSPEHAVLVDDILVQAGALVNGLSIVRESNVAETFVYYHIELAEHALVLAEGTPAESFVDNIHRMAFDNWEEHEALYGDAPIVEMDQPRARSHRQVPMEIRARLLARAATMPALQKEIAA